MYYLIFAQTIKLLYLWFKHLMLIMSRKTHELISTLPVPNFEWFRMVLLFLMYYNRFATKWIIKGHGVVSTILLYQEISIDIHVPNYSLFIRLYRQQHYTIHFSLFYNIIMAYIVYAENIVISGFRRPVLLEEDMKIWFLYYSWFNELGRYIAY